MKKYKIAPERKELLYSDRYNFNNDVSSDSMIEFFNILYVFAMYAFSRKPGRLEH